MKESSKPNPRDGLSAPHSMNIMTLPWWQVCVKRLSFHDSMDLSSLGEIKAAYVSFVFHQCQKPFLLSQTRWDWTKKKFAGSVGNLIRGRKVAELLSHQWVISGNSSMWLIGCHLHFKESWGREDTGLGDVLAHSVKMLHNKNNRHSVPKI